jgi:hypothetical protein
MEERLAGRSSQLKHGEGDLEIIRHERTRILENVMNVLNPFTGDYL